MPRMWSLFLFLWYDWMLAFSFSFSLTRQRSMALCRQQSKATRKQDQKQHQQQQPERAAWASGWQVWMQSRQRSQGWERWRKKEEEEAWLSLLLSLLPLLRLLLLASRWLLSWTLLVLASSSFLCSRSFCCWVPPSFSLQAWLLDLFSLAEPVVLASTLAAAATTAAGRTWGTVIVKKSQHMPWDRGGIRGPSKEVATPSLSRSPLVSSFPAFASALSVLSLSFIVPVVSFSHFSHSSLHQIVLLLLLLLLFVCLVGWLVVWLVVLLLFSLFLSPLSWISFVSRISRRWAWAMAVPSLLCGMWPSAWCCCVLLCWVLSSFSSRCASLTAASARRTRLRPIALSPNLSAAAASREERGDLADDRLRLVAHHDDTW